MPYTDEELRECLRQLRDKLGETPSAPQCRSADITPSDKTYCRRFGSWNAALEAAGLSINEENASYTDAELVACLREFADTRGETPKTRQLKHEPELPSPDVYRTHFNSWNAALEEAGLDENEGFVFTDEELITSLQEFAADLGQTPSKTDIDSRDELPSSTTYETRFGSWNSAIQEAELSVNQEREQYDGTDEELLDMLRDFASERDTSLTVDDVNTAPELPHLSVFARRFGGWNAAKQAAGLAIRTHQNHYSDAELLRELRHVARELDRSPTIPDIEETDGPSSVTYATRFGSWTAALEAAGLQTQEPPTQ